MYVYMFHRYYFQNEFHPLAIGMIGLGNPNHSPLEGGGGGGGGWWWWWGGGGGAGIILSLISA